MTNRPTYADAGFTLLETIIAMTLLAVLMLALSGSIGFVGKTWDKGWNASERTGALAQTEGILRQLLERSFPAVADDQKKVRFVFQGSADGVRLVSYELAGTSPAGYRLSEVSTAAAGGISRVILRQRQLSDPTLNRIEESTLLAGNIVLNFAYYGAQQTSTQPAWYPVWNSDRRLPDLIRIRIRSGAAQIWPTILIRPQVTAEYACISATFAGICRTASVTP